ncbi:protein WHAT'S THIS FACTOR 9, mitochondrial [Rhodamnia argentea]|uniref:Protein WHAT'S THIS FACTOR 9, mitochondrial n=1 Tax=Rhodamnia argentea TaxID=178133 RepID=A0A8B8NW06_9MYRT|nr:protein WHAT'S THIS FACTOR 9, mitochondrial [Rhodamnia argentea]XP_048130872.1 protein WHAT'S THIS FACTOR 9, mitochondrial [Rhodamnia argentea]XP_048130873.1 protein WHAT'S THIS FACTOR 9, mitochondrial [Rhodamnia argentea]
MRSILPKRIGRSSLESHPLSQTPSRTSPSDAAPPICVRDRGLDHAVEREKFLIPVVNLKNLLKSEPSKSLPISVIAQSRDDLRIPIRPIDFVRRYPSIFAEFLPGNVGVHPHFKLTDEVLELDAEEQLVYQRESYRQEAADRVLKLLMMSKVLKMPLDIIDRLKWDMGLPQDFAQSIVPEFPDYFRVVDGEGIRVLELVCWSSDLAKSIMERRAANCTKGMPIEFTTHFSKGFEMDKKLKKWIDDWQKLPYVSPYENGLHLSQSSDEADKWAVAVLHELLNLFVSKKTDRDNMLCVGEYLGVRSRFKRALLDHPGIFYVSSKNRTHTVVLKEVFKRGSLIEQHPLMDMRNRYIHLMNTAKEEKKVITTSGSKQMKKVSDGSEHQREVEDENEDEDDAHGMSDSEVEDDDEDDEFEDDEENDNVKRTRARAHKNASPRGNGTRKSNSFPRYNSRSRVGDKSAGESHSKKTKRALAKLSTRKV